MPSRPFQSTVKEHDKKLANTFEQLYNTTPSRLFARTPVDTRNSQVHKSLLNQQLHQRMSSKEAKVAQERKLMIDRLVKDIMSVKPKVETDNPHRQASFSF